jgi:repressor LexA
MSDATRPTKKQRELLNFIDSFIKGNGYGPSYREVMRALDYKSVSTVATHIDGLITRGFLRKKDNSARTLEVVSQTSAPLAVTDDPLQLAFDRKLQQLRRDDTDESRHSQAVLREAMTLLGISDDDTVA